MTYYTTVTLNKRGNFFPDSNPLTTTDRNLAFREKHRRLAMLLGDYKVIVITSQELTAEVLEG